jgi:peptide/nickel transport system substrate-binding protein
VYEHIDLQLDNPIFQDVRVRRALLHAIDREAINRHLFGGRQPVAHGFVSPLDWMYTDDLPRYPYDPARAAALLDEAGWRRGPDGIRRNANGQKLTFELMTGTGSRLREMVQQVLQSQWRDAGIEVHIRNLPPRVMFGDITNQRKFTGGVMYAWFSAPENVPRTILHSTMIPSPENNWAGQNFVGYRNPEIDRLIDDTERELDREKRRKLWHRIQMIYSTELPVLPLFFRANAYIFPKWLKGVEPTGHQYPTSLWVEHWRVEPVS